MSSLLEPEQDNFYVPSSQANGATSSNVTHQPDPPIPTYKLQRDILGINTELLIQSFDDRILVVITQNGKIGVLTQASIPTHYPLPHPLTPPPSSNPTTATSILPSLPPPPPSLTLLPLLGTPPNSSQPIHDLLVSQVSTLIWWTLQEVGALRRPVVVGSALKPYLSPNGSEEIDDEKERERFAGVCGMVIEWPGPGVGLD